MMDIRVIEIVNSLLLSLSLQTAESQDLRNLFATAGFVTLVRHRGTGVQARARHVITASPLQLGKFLGQSVLRIVSPH